MRKEINHKALNFFEFLFSYFEKDSVLYDIYYSNVSYDVASKIIYDDNQSIIYAICFNFIINEEDVV